jgi:hypothetical protein
MLDSAARGCVRGFATTCFGLARTACACTRGLVASVNSAPRRLSQQADFVFTGV